MEQNNRNFILAIVLSIGVLFFWQYFYAGPKQAEQQAAQRRAQEQAQAQQKAQQQTQQQAQANQQGQPVATSGGGATSGQGAVSTGQHLASHICVANNEVGSSPYASLASSQPVKPTSTSQRIEIDTAHVNGSLTLTGARIDSILFKKHKQTVDKNSPNATLLTPEKYFAEYRWVADCGAAVKLPDENTVWSVEGNNNKLTPTSPVTLLYDNGQGLLFRLLISIDDKYMFTIQQSVENKGQKAVQLYSHAILARHEHPKTENFIVLHEGPTANVSKNADKVFNQVTYDNLIKQGQTSYAGEGGWIGFGDKYWMTALIPDQKLRYSAKFRGMKGTRELFQADYLLPAMSVEPGKTATVSSHLFTGVKQANLAYEYQEKYNIVQFDNIVNWGLYAFLTKPFYWLLHYLYELAGNFGLAILMLTVLIKLVMFPLANKSYVSMSKMKQLQPEMQRIRERFKDDRMRQQQAMMDLYKKEKINPMAGCLPIFIQIPVFFALYKVIYISVDMRHAPFFGWIQDLSAPDPTTLFNLFGLIPWSPPTILMVGIWPILMGISMWVQMKLNPQQADPIQQQIFNWMPLIFTFLLAPFAAGLVIYWTWNNILSIAQQWVIMAKQGVKVDLFESLGFSKAADKKSANDNKPIGKTGAKKT